MRLFAPSSILGRAVLLLALSWCGAATAQQVVIARANATVVLEPFAPNVVRVTLSLYRASALRFPGVGIRAAPTISGWTHTNANGEDSFRSDRMVVHISP